MSRPPKAQTSFRTKVNPVQAGSNMKNPFDPELTAEVSDLEPDRHIQIGDLETAETFSKTRPHHQRQVRPGKRAAY